MPKLKVKRGKLPFKSLDEGEKSALLEFQKIQSLALRSIRHLITNATPSQDQHNVQGVGIRERPLQKAVQAALLTRRDEQTTRDERRRAQYGAPDPVKVATQGKLYAVQSYLEPIAAMARLMTLEDFKTSFSPPGNKEETEARSYSDAREAEKASYWTHAYGSIRHDGYSDDEAHVHIESNTKWKTLKGAAQDAAQLYAQVHKKWEKRRMLALEATKRAKEYADQDGIHPSTPDPAEFWQQARVK